VVPLSSGAPVSGMITALASQVDLVPVGLDPGYSVFENTDWVPELAVLSANFELAQLSQVAAAANPWASAYLQQQLNLSVLATPLAPGPGPLSTSRVLATPAADVLYGSAPPGAWRVAADGRRLTGHPLGNQATWWALPPGRDTVTATTTGSGGQQLADLVLLLAWAVALWAAWASLRRGAVRFAMANLQLGSPSAEVVEIHWPVPEVGPVG